MERNVRFFGHWFIPGDNQGRSLAPPMTVANSRALRWSDGESRRGWDGSGESGKAEKLAQAAGGRASPLLR